MAGGHNYLTAFAYGDGYLDYPGLGWTVIVREPVDNAFAPVSTLKERLLLICAAAAIISP